MADHSRGVVRVQFNPLKQPRHQVPVPARKKTTTLIYDHSCSEAPTAAGARRGKDRAPDRTWQRLPDGAISTPRTLA